MDVVLVDALLKQMEKGENRQHIYEHYFYKCCRVGGSKFEKLDFSVSNVKNRLKALKKRHTDAQKVLSQSGFGYNESTQMIEAPPEVWQTYLTA